MENMYIPLLLTILQEGDMEGKKEENVVEKKGEDREDVVKE